MRISTSMMNQSALNGIETAEAAASQTQAQLSTSKRINTPADDPVGAVQLLQLNTVNAQNSQYLSNGTAANTNLSLENSALTTATNTLQSIRDLVVQANSGTNTPSDLKDIATQISSLESQLQGAANTQNSQGQYLFAGFSSTTQPFVRGSSGSMTYVGDNGTSSVQIDSGTSVQTGDPGSSVFMNIQGGNGTFSVSSGSNSATGVADAGSVLSALTYQTAQATSPAPYTITFSTPNSYTVTDGATPANTVTTGTYNPTSGGEVQFNGIEIGITGSPAAGDTFTVAPAAKQSVFNTIDNIVSTLNNAGSGSAAKAQLSTVLGNSLQQIDNASSQITNVAANVGARINLISSSANSVNTNSTTVSA
ncbi:MAG TPA: flagellar hook-associated protein FlgL, partial [Steroidobacteraceae bacterium]|nr:flagellar hook-associated protein FlgL [Steroidobacteraceae bacterium]